MERLSNENFAKQAEEVIKGLIITDRNGRPKITTSKIRNLLTMTNVVYNQARQEKEKEISEELLHNVQYLKMRFAYEAGRETSVKDFVNKAEILEHINGIGKDREGLLLFCHYIEALVAYHKYYGGKDR